jgi:hypothetical protein
MTSWLVDGNLSPKLGRQPASTGRRANPYLRCILR